MSSWTVVLKSIISLILHYGHFHTEHVLFQIFKLPRSQPALLYSSKIFIQNSRFLIFDFSIRSNAFDPAYSWRENAWKNLAECPLSYHYVRTFSRLLECDLLVYRSQKFYNKMPYCTLLKDGDITKTVKQNMKTFESYCERFPIFIPRLMMFKSFLEQLNDSSKAKGGSKAREFLNSGIACAKAMNDKPSVERLTSNLEYLEGKRRLV